MGHEWKAGAGLVQRFTAAPFGIFNAALWNRSDGALLYLNGPDFQLSSYRIRGGQIDAGPVSNNQSIRLGLFPGLTISSNGTTPGSGILWVTTGTAISGSTAMAGTLHALDALDLNHEFWSSNVEAARDTLGNFTKFANPTVANGKVFVPTDSGQLTVYGILPAPGVRVLTNAASLRTSSISPGEIISILGNQIGPVDAVSNTVGSDGRISESASGYRVTFDEDAAPLLEASADRILAIVPFSVEGREWSTMRVESPDGNAFTVPVPVATATPSIFTAQGGGSGQGAVLNQDGTANSVQNPAVRGSVVSIFATGTGPLAPAVADGAILSTNQPPALAFPVTVTIGGLPATVTYQGGAPGQVAGMAQINAVVPNGVRAGAAVSVRIAAGGVSSPNRVTLAVK
jgi:uncharacterized protein (TIGR03437 family)